MAGAAYLSARAAYTCGAGLVRIYTEESNRAVLQQLLPEAIVTSYERYDGEQLLSLLQWADVVCIGCGLGQDGTSESLLKGTLRGSRVPCLVDADGIIAAWAEYMELGEPQEYENTNPLAENTPYFKKYTFSGMDKEDVVATVGYYEGINELYLKISR